MTDQIRARLREMIPDLPHPPDRLDAIASRVRRTRRRRAALASALTAVGVLAVAVTTVSVRPAPALKPPPTYVSCVPYTSPTNCTVPEDAITMLPGRASADEVTVCVPDPTSSRIVSWSHS